MCKVLNVRQVGKRPTADRVYVGRPSGDYYRLLQEVREHGAWASI
jgi:hypothetical protein